MAPFRTWGIHGRVVMQTLVLYQLDLYPNHTISANAPNKCCPFSISENHAKVAPPRCRKAKSSETQIFKNVKKCPPSSFQSVCLSLSLSLFFLKLGYTFQSKPRKRGLSLGQATEGRARRGPPWSVAPNFLSMFEQKWQHKIMAMMVPSIQYQHTLWSQLATICYSNMFLPKSFEQRMVVNCDHMIYILAFGYNLFSKTCCKHEKNTFEVTGLGDAEL